MRLRPLVGRGGALHRAAPVVGEVVALGRAVDPVSPVQAGVEPLRRVGRRVLTSQREAQLVEEGAGVVLAVEVAALPAPIGPGPGQTIEHLGGLRLTAVAPVLGQVGKRRGIRLLAAQPLRHALLLDRAQARRDPGLAKILLGEHVDRDLRPGARHLDVVGPEHHRAVRIADLAARRAELDGVVGGGPRGREGARDPHDRTSPPAAAARAA